jgi:hypothetical protein
MSWFFDTLFKRGSAKLKDSKPSSYDTSRTETNTPQKVRESNEPEAIQKRDAESKGESPDGLR